MIRLTIQVYSDHVTIKRVYDLSVIVDRNFSRTCVRDHLVLDFSG